MAHTAINLNGNGEILEQAGVFSEILTKRVDVGVYEVRGSLGIAKTGWKTSIYQNENGENTITLVTEYAGGILTIRTYDPETGSPKDIESALTLRLEVEEPEQAIE